LVAAGFEPVDGAADCEVAEELSGGITNAVLDLAGV
jgi:hypothetical protein